MHQKKHPHSFHVITNIRDITSKHLFVEVLEKKDVSLSFFELGNEREQSVIKHLKNTDNSKEKVLTWMLHDSQFESITFFFPNRSSLLDDRSQAFRNLSKDMLIIPSESYSEAYEALVLSLYSYQKYLTKKKQYRFEMLVPEKEKEVILAKKPLYDAIYETRDIINEPPSNSYPEAIVEHILERKWKHFDVHVFDHNELRRLGCELLLAVGAGSEFPPYMVILTPKKPLKGEKYALVGKGVTFDAGGIQIKPDTAMLDMKCDMSGAAGVIGVAKYLDSFDELPVNIIVGVGITENMTGGRAFKPLDIYKAYNGTTVEIHHTDAEGRLVLADVMSYIESTYHVDHIITMATLTGACVYALGHDIAGIMGDDEEVIKSLITSGSPYEPVWRLPLNEKIKKSLKAEIADLKNVARSEKAGSSVGGAFLSYFQGKAKFTHIDIAGPAYRETNWGYMPKGATGWGVKILSEFLLSLKKKKSKKGTL